MMSEEIADPSIYFGEGGQSRLKSGGGHTHKREPSIPTLHVDTNRAFDAKIEDDLEKINKAVTEINRLSGEVFQSRQKFQECYKAAKSKLDKLYISSKRAIEHARPYFKHRVQVMRLRTELRAIQVEYDRVKLEFEDSKENEAVAEKVLMSSIAKKTDSVMQDVDILTNLNKANQRVVDVSKDMSEVSTTMGQVKQRYDDSAAILSALTNNLKKDIEKSWYGINSLFSSWFTFYLKRSYYQLRDHFKKQLEKQASTVRLKTRHLQESKDKYRVAFASLDVISTEIVQRHGQLENEKEDLSKFEEIQEIGTIMELDNSKSSPKRRAPTSMYRLDSLDSTFGSECGSDENLHRVCPISLDQIAWKDLLEDPENDPRILLNNYGVSFEMRL